MIPLCCSNTSGNQALKLGARFDEKRKIFFIDNRHNRHNFKKWLPRYYRPSSSQKQELVIKTYWMPCDSPAKDLKSLMGTEKFMLLKAKINELNGHICQICGDHSSLWVVPVFKNNIDNKKHELGQTLVSVLGACGDCAKVSLGIYLNAEKVSMLNNISQDEAVKEFRKQKEKNEKCSFEHYEVNIEKAYQLIGSGNKNGV